MGGLSHPSELPLTHWEDSQNLGVSLPVLPPHPHPCTASGPGLELRSGSHGCLPRH